jgi:hypothetical protein
MGKLQIVKSRYFLNWLLEKAFQRFLDCQFTLKRTDSLFKDLTLATHFQIGDANPSERRCWSGWRECGAAGGRRCSGPCWGPS